MRDKMESLVVLPFSLGCVSPSDVAVGGYYHTKKTKSESNSGVTRKQEGEESLSAEEVNMKNSWSFLAIPKPNISSGVHRLVKTIKSFSHLFVYKEENEEEQSESEMEIGLPTDVKHVTHIGWDGTNSTMIKKPDEKGSSWENLGPVTVPPEFLSFPNSVSLRQFELAMAAQPDHAPLCLNTSNKFA